MASDYDWRVSITAAVRQLQERVGEFERGYVVGGRTADGAPVYTLAPVKPAEGDALEMLRHVLTMTRDHPSQWSNAALAGYLEPIIAAIEAELAEAYERRVRSACEWDEALVAEKRAHADTVRTLDKTTLELRETWSEGRRAQEESATLRAKLEETEEFRATVTKPTGKGMVSRAVYDCATNALNDTVTALQKDLTEAEKRYRFAEEQLASVASDRDQCAQVLEQVNAVAEGLRGRIERAAATLKLAANDEQDWNSVALAKNVLATLTAPSETAGKVTEEGE